MNPRTRRLLPLALVALAGTAAAQPVVFTQWRFNNQPAGQINNNPAPSTGRGTAVPLGMTNPYEYYTSPHRFGSYTTCDMPSAGASGDSGAPNNCWRVRGSYDGTLANAGVGYSIFAPEFTQGAEFDVSTVNYAGVVFTFDWFTTNQGVHNMQAQYSPDAGATWISTGPILASATNAWINNVTVDLSAIPDVNDNPDFRVRLVSVYDPSYSGQGAPTYTGASGGQYNNASGNWRFDRVTFTGTPLRSVPPSCSGAVTPPAVCSSGGTLTFAVEVASGVLPISSGLQVAADLSALGLPADQPLFDDGTHGDPVAGDSVFTLAASIPAGRTPGSFSIPATVSDAQGRSGATSIPVTVGDCSGSSNARVVISQTFAGGGNLGSIPAEDAPFNADYVELLNRSNQPVSLDGWSVQYASPASAGGFDNPTDQVLLSGLIQPGQHVLIRMSDPVPGFNPLPTPDFAQLTAQGGMGNTGGRVVLARTTQLLHTSFNDPSIEDLVGYGAAAVTFEGAAPTATPSPVNATAATRRQDGAQDSNQNFNDFQISTPTPRNRASGGFLAGYPSASAPAVCTSTDVTFEVAVQPGNASTGISVTADLSDVVGLPTLLPMFDDGTHGDAHAGDGTFSLTYTVSGSAPQGVRSVAFTVADQQGHADTSRLPLEIGTCNPSPAPVVISRVYGGGGNDLSGFNGDFAEIFNRSQAPVDLAGWSFQSARVSDAGFDSRIAYLSGTINPGEYRLIVTNQLSATGAVLPNADFTPDALFGMESSFGRVALLSSTDLLHADYTRADVVDLVGYGTQAQSFEGVGPTPTLGDILVAVRKDGGCRDTNQNAMDFDVLLALELPRNSASPVNTCTPVCRSDFNGDGFLDFFDYDDYVNCFETGACPPARNADFNGDGFADFFDYDDFVAAFEVGC